MPDVYDHGEDVVAMAQFGEVLDAMRLALAWASPAEVRALLEGLVEDRIISGAYSKSLSLHRPAHGETGCKPGLDQMNSPCSDIHHYLNKDQSVEVSCQESPISDPNQTRWEPVSPTDEQTNTRSGPEIDPLDWIEEHYLSTPNYEHSIRLDDEMTKLLRHAESVQTPASDNERMKRGNLEDEKEWLEQVEEEARQIAVPVWQHWDRRRRMLLPLVPSLTASKNTATGRESQCSVLNMEEETELAAACKTLDLYADKFNCTEPNFTLGTVATDTLKGLGFSAYNSTATTGWDHLDASPVEACAATDTSGSITDRLLGELDGCWVADGSTGATEDQLCLTADAQCGFPGLAEDIGYLLSSCEPTDTHTNAQDNSLYSNSDHSPTFSVLESVSRAAGGTDTCSSDDIADFHEDKEDEEMVDPQWSKCIVVLLPIFTSVLIKMIHRGYRNTAKAFNFMVVRGSPNFFSVQDLLVPPSFPFPAFQQQSWSENNPCLWFLLDACLFCCFRQKGWAGFGVKGVPYFQFHSELLGCGA